MLTCEQALELISAQLDGALTAEEAGALDEHLAQCPACRALRADLSTLHQLLPTLAEEPPAGLKDDIMKAVHASKCTPFHTGKRQWRWRSWASLAAVLVLVLVGGQAVHLWSPPGSSGSVPRANLAGLTGAASGGSAGQTAPAQEDRAGPAGEPAEAASGSADGANRKDSSAGERPTASRRRTGLFTPSLWTGVPSLRNPPDLHTRPVLPAACFYSAAAH